MMAYFPFFVDLSGREGLIVGGGAVALRKVQKLLPYGPRLTVVAPEISPKFEELEQVDLCRRPFAAVDLDGCDFAVAATNDLNLRQHGFNGILYQSSYGIICNDTWART